MFTVMGDDIGVELEIPWHLRQHGSNLTSTNQRK
jgi:hypothetical protein